MDRRNFMKSAGLVTGALAARVAADTDSAIRSLRRSDHQVNHSVCKWCYPDMTVSQLAEAAAKLGIQSVELLDPEEWMAARAHGLTCAMANGPMTIEVGFNHEENHDRLIPDYLKRVEEVAADGLRNVICFSGNRNGISEKRGLDNCVKGLRPVVEAAERAGITVCMELLNSRVNHLDYQCDRTEWGVELCDRVGSDHFKLLYDIYHMQIMEGDIIRTIRTYHPYIAHYHTGGNPGRNEIDESQELNYRAIMEAIVETGHTGYVAQEFIPTRDPITSLAEAIEICDV